MNGDEAGRATTDGRLERLAPDGPDAMGRETAEGPAAVEATLGAVAATPEARDAFAGADRVVLVGTGASLAVIEAAAPLLAPVAGARGASVLVREAAAAALGDTDGRAFAPGDLVVAVSMSGASPETRAAAARARSAGATVVAVTARPGSPLAALASNVVETPIGQETGAATKSELSAFAALAGLAGLLPVDRAAAVRLRRRLDALVADVAPIRDPAFAVATARHAWSLGFGPALGLARAAALLLHEKARRPAVFSTPSEFRHGPIEAATPDDVVLLVEAGMPPDPARGRYLARLAGELDELGVPLVAVGAGVPGRWPIAIGGSGADSVLDAFIRLQQLARFVAHASGAYREEFLVLRRIVTAADDLVDGDDPVDRPATDGSDEPG